MQSCSGIWAGVWLTVPPTEHGLSFLDAEYQALVRFRMRLPIMPGGGRCQRLSRRPHGGRWGRAWYDPEGDHAHACPLNAGARTRRHNHLRDELRRQLRWLGFWAETEQEDSRLPHRPDVRAHGFSLPVTHFEVHVSHPSQRQPETWAPRRGRSNTAFVEEVWNRRLRVDYGGGPPANASFNLVPAVVSSFGGWHPAFAQWWRGAVRAAAERAGALAHTTNMLWRSVGFLSVILQRQNFLVLAGCAPTLANEVTGQLGRPLSETPEFWRAAPEAAVQWSAEEFDFPPEAAEQSRGTNLGLPPPFGDGAVEPEDSPLAVGLLRASGMQI